MASVSTSASSRLSASDIARDLVHDPHGGSFPSCFFDDRIVGQRTRFAYPGDRDYVNVGLTADADSSRTGAGRV